MTGRFIKLSGWMLAITLPLLLMAGSVVAGGIINKMNQSTDYLRSLNRNAATDYADIAVYNPAGIMQMEDGLVRQAGPDVLQQGLLKRCAGIRQARTG